MVTVEQQHIISGEAAQQKLYQQVYDFVILGMGCAGLSLAMRMASHPFFAQKKILLVDKAFKNQNDRTWCFWEKSAGFFEDIVLQQWDALDFFSNDYCGALDMGGYRYKMIRGIDFYTHCLSFLRQFTNITICTDTVVSASGEEVVLGRGVIECRGALVFSSLPQLQSPQKGRYALLQHFKGWLIETPGHSFDERRATLMDFRINQQPGTSFVYVMPLSNKKALIEYTLFTPQLLEAGAYDTVLKEYIANTLGIKHWNLEAEEFGVIPMSSSPYPRQMNGVFYTGTAGGQTKASSGYTFQFIQKQAAQIVKNLAEGRPSFAGEPLAHKRFSLYDNTLLHILSEGIIPGDKVFARLFSRNKASRLFRFLDNETNLLTELQIMASVPQRLFIKAALKEMKKGF